MTCQVDLAWLHDTQPFYNPFSGTTRVIRCQKKTSGLLVQGKINRGRHTDHPAGRHSIRTNQCPPPPSPHNFYGPDALPAAQPTVSKHWRQQSKHMINETNTSPSQRISFITSFKHTMQCHTQQNRPTQNLRGDVSSLKILFQQS